ncbi:TauD/TfdA family dioxygenase [Seohaeicola saemankumensis]|nr:TauD/TfdA family dioxygenase [Seohaeicola saemankumensis]MCA0869233.1 TauD/TfdA family dioxygenase [Seohaeicola saemankumensis]
MTLKIPQFEWLDLGNSRAYAEWRTAKMAAARAVRDLAPVAIDDLANPSEAARDALIERCELVNYAVYDSPPVPQDNPATAARLRRFAQAFALKIAESHRSAGDYGIVALSPSDQPGKRGYIPYSTRGMNWHTDGYYNPPDQRISAFVLHCVRAAPVGGVNQLLDPELLYIRLRDHHLDWLRALLHPQAMSIPENREADGTLRPVSVGPVFYPDPETGRMQMRYTARTRSIDWRNDPDTRAAEAFLRDYLARGDPLATDLHLAPGQGVLNNNVLHNRTPFEPGRNGDSRLIYRVRFHNRVKRRPEWQNSAT